MSAVNVNARDLQACLSQITPLVPKGTLYVPLGLHVHDNLLVITCLQGCVFQSHIPIGSDEVMSISVMYRDVTPLLPGSGEVTLEFATNFLELTASGISVSLYNSYSVVQEQKFEEYVYTDILHDDYIYNLRTMLGMNLDNIYKAVKPVNVYDKVALLKFPNTIVQVRTTGLPINCVLDVEHIKLLLRFRPTKVCRDGYLLTFLNDNAVLQLPCKDNVDKNTFVDMLEDLGEPVSINIDGYLDKVRNLSKALSKGKCTVVIYSDGITTKLFADNTNASVSIGNMSTEVIKVLNIPTQIWLSFLKAMGNSNIQVLVGGGKLCLRNNSVVILTRVLL